MTKCLSFLWKKLKKGQPSYQALDLEPLRSIQTILTEPKDSNSDSDDDTTSNHHSATAPSSPTPRCGNCLIV